MCENQPKPRSCITCPKYDGMQCTATDFTLGPRDEVLQEEHRRGFICIDTGEAELKGDAAMKWAVEQQRCSEEQGFRSVSEMWEAQGKRVSEGWSDGPAVVVSPAGSPSSECPSLREGPPQKGKIDENNPSDTSLIPSGTIVAGEGIQLIENPGPIWKDTNGYWEPVKPRSCTTCKGYNDPICMKIATHIGTREEIWDKEQRDGFQCIAALPKEEREAIITSIGCNKKETR